MRGSVWLAACVCLMGLGKPSLAQSPATVEERLSAYEQTIQDLRKQMEQLRKEVDDLRAQQARAVTKPPAAAPGAPASAAARPRAEVFGYLQSQFETGSPQGASRFFVRRARLGVRGQLEQSLGYEMQVDAAASTSILRNLFVDYTGWKAGTWSPTLRLGQAKPAYSLESFESHATLPFIERALAVEQIAFNHERDTGLFLLSRPDPNRPYAYHLSLTNGAGRNQFVATRQKLFAGRIQLNSTRDHPVLGGTLAVGVSTRQGHTENLNLPTGRRAEDERYGVDLDFLTRRLRLRGEYLWGRNEGEEPRGYYGMVAYRLRPPLELLARYEGFTPDAGNGAASNRTTLGLTYYLSRSTKAMLNYESLHGKPPNDLRSGVRVRMQTAFP